MIRQVLARILRPFGRVRQREAVTVLLMFLYSFLAVAAYNVIKPATRSKFIDDLGAVNIPFAQLIAGVLTSLVMAGYGWLISRLPRRWCLPITQGVIAGVLLIFWYLFRFDAAWVSAAFYLVGLVLGILLISQFWTLANVVYDPRQAKRLFGFIGGGSSLGGILGSFLATRYAQSLGSGNLLLFSIAFMLLCLALVSVIVRREQIGEEGQLAAAGSEKGFSGKEGIKLLRKSKHLRLIALIISFAAIGATIIDQQLNMAAGAAKGPAAEDSITAFLAHVQLWSSVIGFLVQITLTSRIHRYLGIGFALLLLPMSLGASGLIMLLNAALWAPGLARVLDQSLRYTVDKTSREILYMPLPSDVKYAGKPFVDVSVERFARGIAAVLLLVLIQPWGFGLSWQKLSYASLIMTSVWIFLALKAARGYKIALRQSIAAGDMKPGEVSREIADLATVETLIQELASPDERRVLYAIELLESLDKRNLITPLLLYHESPAVRARALASISALQPEVAARWLPIIQGMMRNENPEVRSAAVGALAHMHNQQAIDLVQPLLQDEDPRIVLTAAMVLAESQSDADAAAAERILTGFVFDTRDSAAAVRKDFAIAIRNVPIPRFRHLLIPLLSDAISEVADEAMYSIRKLGVSDFIFVPTLISLLRHRRLKSNAREVLVTYGEPAVPILGHFLRDPDEDIWIRRHIPAVIARIPCQQAMNCLIGALAEKDGFLRFHVIAGLEKLHRQHPELSFNHEPVETLILREIVRHSDYRMLHRRLCKDHRLPKDCLLVCTIEEKMRRTVDRVYRLLGLLYPWRDIAAARHTIEHGDARSRAGALEYLDNLLSTTLRKKLVPLLEEASPDEEVREDSVAPRRTALSTEHTLLRLINDEDPVLAAAAVYSVWQQRLSSLAKELEWVLENRDPRDIYVIEAVSWVLSAFGMLEASRSIPANEPLPTVEMAERLRSLPLFGSVTIDELFRISTTGRQVRYDPGWLLCQERRVPDQVLFLLDGRVALQPSLGSAREVNAPAAFGFQEVLEGMPMTETARTTDPAICLTLTNEEIHALLADNTGLVPGLFQMLCCGTDQTRRLVVKGKPSGQHILAPNGTLKPVEKGLVLKTIPLFSDASAEETIALASIVSEVRLEAGALLFREADPPALFTLVTGELRIESSKEAPALDVGPSDVIAIFQTLAGIAFECRATVTKSCLALRIDREDLFDLLAQRPALLRQIFSALFRTGMRPLKT